MIGFLLAVWTTTSAATALMEGITTAFGGTDDRGFARKRLVHRVRWTDVEHLTVFHGNGLSGPGTVLHLAWRCRPRQPGPGRQPWAGGGRNFAGEEFDGALPDPYAGIEPMLDLFKDRVDATKARASIGGRFEA